MTKLSRYYLQYFLAKHIRYFLYFYSCTRHDSFYDNQFQNLKKKDTMLQQKVSQRHSSYCSGSKYNTSKGYCSSSSYQISEQCWASAYQCVI
ncbi:hypothetical protein ERO13_D04G082050v2 [Gossypium hirsutum]|uniref:Uncharacterized protein n=3 Tax=Gossypium TaxID=3633 RepID=A0A0D2TLJ0_GOSRA|nr:hypothetical protein ES319_D04G092100v1 [Gossypium barbadense]KAG4151702.1 hypothetical protein ERO13_D04G082050v2 [Gossypium hirsutum]KJB76523.1 hypothetical protein B456_012G092800 [Gossypium raimondii]TYI86825.1 hypothetical protein E1A91_D04G092700v1 [Gossypium mustelinum]